MYDCVKEEELGLFGYVKASDKRILKVVGETLQLGETKVQIQCFCSSGAGFA